MNNLNHAIETYRTTKEEVLAINEQSEEVKAINEELLEELEQDIDIEIDILKEQAREQEEGRRDCDIEFYGIEEEG